MDSNDVIKSAALRQRAYQRLGGVAPRDSRQGAIAALGVLHDLACSPASAPDALALLHELQVHQVELTMQDEDLRASVADLEATLAGQLAREEFAPVALYGVDQHLRVLSLNLAGLQLLGCTREEAVGRSIVERFEAADVPLLRAQFALRDARVAREQVRVRLLAQAGQQRDVMVGVAADPALPGQFRVAVMPVGMPAAEDPHPGPDSR